MASIVFNAPRHLQPNEVMTWAPGVLFVNNRPLHLGKGDYLYVCHRNQIIFRAEWQKTVWLEHKVTTESEDRGPGWALQVGDPQLPPHQIIRRSHTGFSYLPKGELW
jgi:hypothetical protein